MIDLYEFTSAKKAKITINDGREYVCECLTVADKDDTGDTENALDTVLISGPDKTPTFHESEINSIEMLVVVIASVVD